MYLAKQIDNLTQFNDYERSLCKNQNKQTA